MLLAGKIIFLFIGVWFTLINVAKFIRNEPISPTNFIAQATGIVGFIVLQWLV